MSGQDRPTLPGIRDILGGPDPRDPRRQRTPAPGDPRYPVLPSQAQYPVLHGGQVPGQQRPYPYPYPTPAGGSGHYAQPPQQYGHQPPPPRPSRPLSMPAPPTQPQYHHSTQPAAYRSPPVQTQAPTGGHFSIMRTNYGQNPLTVASSATTYSGLSGNIRPLRHGEYSQYAVDTATAEGMDVKYQCPHCGKGFDRPSSLRTHINSHTGEKPYTCSHPGCGRQFGVLSNMYRHMRTAHGQGGSGAQDGEDDDSEGRNA